MEENLSKQNTKEDHPCGLACITEKITGVFNKKQGIKKESKLGKFYNKEDISSLVESFPEQLETDIISGISTRLIQVLSGEHHPINPQKYLDVKGNKARKQELINQLSTSPEELESILLYVYNRNFWNTHIKDGNKLNDLKLHYPGFAKQERLDFGNWKHFGAAEGAVTTCGRKINELSKKFFGVGVQDIMEKYYKPHLLEMSESEEAMIEEILLGLERGEKFFIILNHDTFANIPLAILKFMKKAEELGIKNVNRFFTTIIGPLLNTHKLQNITINSLSNVVITHPAGNQIPGTKPLISLQQKNALLQIMKDLKQGGEGQIYFCSPSGTRDVVVYGKDEEGNSTSYIYLPDETWGSNISTINLVNKLKKNNPELKIYALSTNTTALKQGISPNDNSWNKEADILMHIQELNNSPLTPEEVTLTLAKGIKSPIKNKNGEIIDEKTNTLLVPDYVFKKLKKWSKTGNYPEGLFDKDGSLKTEHLGEILNQEKEF